MLTQNSVLKNIKNYQSKVGVQEKKNPPKNLEREGEPFFFFFVRENYA